MINKTIAAAGGLSLGLTAVHVFGGGQSVHVPALASDASDVVKGFISVVWHGVTANLLICSIMLLMAAWTEAHRRVLTCLVIANYLAFAGLFLFYGVTRLGTVFLMTPWVAFLFIVAIAAIGLLRTNGAQGGDAHA